MTSKTQVVVMNDCGEIIAGKADSLHKGGDLVLWSVIFWRLKGVWDNESPEDICNRTRSILSKMGDISTRSKEENRKLFETLANEQIKRIERDRKHKEA